jgi:cytochrome b5
MSTSPVKKVTKEQVAQHASNDSMWIILHGRAYDVTSFLREHPGGPDILKTVAGRDGTEDFEDTFHSRSAREQLKQFYKGDVEGMEQTDIFATPAVGGKGGATSGGTLAPVLVLALLVLVAAVIYKVAM